LDIVLGAWRLDAVLRQPGWRRSTLMHHAAEREDPGDGLQAVEDHVELAAVLDQEDQLEDRAVPNLAKAGPR